MARGGHAGCSRHERGACTAVAALARTNQRVKEIKAVLEAVGLGVKDGIQVSSMHNAKGLEFGKVFVVGAGADRIPNPWAGEYRKKEGVYDVWLEQERNLLHVAVTRASESVVLSWAGEPSPFLDRALGDVEITRGVQVRDYGGVRLDTSRLQHDPAGLRQSAADSEIGAKQIATFLRPYAEQVVVEGRLK